VAPGTLEGQMAIKVIVIIVALGLVAPIAAHHSWTADYDGGKPVTVKGVVTKVEWTNPHTHFYIEAKDEKGTVTMWNFEMASTLALERAGWSRKTLQAGDQVTITGFGGRAVTERAIAQTITTADGRALFAGKLGQ
jgi:DNA/RNA endonuclease YhcR with UshA esterase domain